MQIIKFLGNSGLAALVNILTGHFLYGVLGLSVGWQYSFSVATAFLVGMVVSYTLNRRFTFEPSGRRKRRELPDFLLVSLGGLAITTSLAQYLFSHYAGQLSTFGAGTGVPIGPETLAHIIAVGLGSFYSFTAHKYFSFRSAPQHEPAGQSRSDRPGAVINKAHK